MSPSTGPLPDLTDEEIIAELRARVHRNLSKQATNTSETEVITGRLPPESRRAITEEINKLNPVPEDVDRLPADHRKEDKDSAADPSRHGTKKPKGAKH